MSSVNVSGVPGYSGALIDVDHVSVLSQEELTEKVAPPSLRGYDAKAVSVATSVDTGDRSKVQQHFAEEVDVNTIMRRHGITAALPLGPATGVYGDFTDIHDYESAVERVKGAEKRFAELPAEVRERFKNDPGLLIRRATEMEPEAFGALFVGNEPVSQNNGSGDVVS